jgi:predicted PurR-regulated permease PerM
MFATFCLVVTALYFGQAVLVPLALAVLFTFLLTPFVVRLERIGVPRAVASTAVVVVGVSLIGVLGWTLSNQAVDLANQLPQYKKNVSDKISHLPFLHSDGAFSKLTTAADELKSQISPADASKEKPLPVTITDDSPVGMTQISALLGAIAGPLATAFIVAVFAIFMLIRREDLRDRLIRLVGGGRLDITTQALSEAGNRISRYLLMQSLVNACYGLVIGTGLWSIGHFSGQPGGFPDAPLWGLLCGLFRFVPYVGPPLGAFFPVLLSIAVFPGAKEFVATVCLFVCVEVLNNSTIEPLLYGATTGLSAVAVLAAAVFWSWLWGPIGLLLSTPLTACLLVIGEYTPQMEFLRVLLGDEPPLSPATRLYQRLLALDAEQASDVIDEYHKSMSLEELYDTVIIPSLAMAERDHHLNYLDEARQEKMRQIVRDILDELGDRERALAIKKEAAEAERAAKSDPAPPAPEVDARPHLPNKCSVTVLCLPAHDESDELVAIMMSQLLEFRGYFAPPMSQSALASEMLDAVEAKAADIILVSALPPTAITHSRYLCKRLQSRFPSISIVVGLWTFESDPSHAKERIAGDQSTVHICTSLRDALREIHQIAQATLLESRREKKVEPVPAEGSAKPALQLGA